jgi:hypothetical protein
MIIKTGFCTGHLFGNNIFQLPYTSITGAQVNAHIAFGYFELSAGGIQNVRMSVWQDASNAWNYRRGTQAPQSPQKAPHCVSLNRLLFQSFRNAGAFVLEKAEQFRSIPTRAAPSSIDALQQLAALRDSGILTDAEFQTKKAEILARV